ncbi:MAG: hypothetical protein V2A65_07705 [Candidatus Omnitrophota bacterium]
MKKNRWVGMMFLLIFLTSIASVYGGEITLKTEGLMVKVDSTGKLKVTDLITNTEAKKYIDSFTILNGKNKDEELNPGAPEKTEQSENGFKSVYRNVGGFLNITQSFERADKFIKSTIEIENTGSEQAWLKVRFNMPVVSSTDNLVYWNGNNLYEEIFDDLKREELFNTFPMACAYSKKSGVAVGIEAHQIFSHIENGLLYNTNQPVIYYGVKLVVDPKKVNKVEFITYTFNPDYGYLNAVDSYQKIFPDMFGAKTGVDKRVYTTAMTTSSLYYYEVQGRPDSLYISPEFPRRHFGGWVWGYAPVQVIGDWYGTKEITENPDLHSMKDVEYGSYETFQKNRRKGIEAASVRNAAYMFYVINWCDKKLADKFYPDCIVTDKNTTNLCNGWVLMNDADYRMWCGGNKFSQDMQRDIKKIAEELPISGFSLDCVSGPALCRQTGVETMEGKAYDSEGVYAREGSGMAKMMDYIHGLKRDDKTMGISSNLAGNALQYYVAMRTDNALTDWAFSEALNNITAEEIQRYLLGTRPQNWCILIDSEKYGSTLPWQEYSPEKIRQIYNNIRDNLILFSYRFAYFPHQALSWGNVKIMKAMPVFQKLIAAGYQVIPAVKLNEDLWRARYGNDLNSYLFIGNQKFTAQQITATIDNRYLGKRVYLFSKYDGTPVDNLIENNKTVINYSLKPKEPLILKAVLGIKDCGGAKVTGKAEEAGDIKSGRVKISLKSTKGIKTEISVRLPEENSAVEVKVNDQAIGFKSGESRVVFAATLGTDNKIEVGWKSNLFQVSEEQVLAYQFITPEGKSRCTIVVDDAADENDNNTAFRLQEYFRYYYEKVKKDPGVKIPIKKKSEAGELKNAVLIGIDAKSGYGINISAENNNLVITAPDSLTRFEMVNRLMMVLDKKYVYYGVIGDPADANVYTRDPATQKMREKAGLGVGTVWEE